jgi:hypothetical protein
MSATCQEVRVPCVTQRGYYMSRLFITTEKSRPNPSLPSPSPRSLPICQRGGGLSDSTFVVCKVTYRGKTSNGGVSIVMESDSNGPINFGQGRIWKVPHLCHEYRSVYPRFMSKPRSQRHVIGCHVAMRLSWVNKG